MVYMEAKCDLQTTHWSMLFANVHLSFILVLRLFMFILELSAIYVAHYSNHTLIIYAFYFIVCLY